MEALLIGALWGFLFGHTYEKAHIPKDCKIVTERVIDHAGQKEVKICKK